jgi:phosphatidate cytidylyltransferase
VSPKKSWEGAIGATVVVVAVAAGAVASSVTVLDTFGRSAGLAVVVAVFAPLGDLAESLIKRDLGIKDMGGVLPGHGGVLDRIDSILFVVPAALLYLRLL